jgi:hypothetical protein
MREGLDLDLAQILSVGIAVRRDVNVGASVRHHVDPADLEGLAAVIVRGRLLAREKVADVRPRKPFVGDHALRDDVA